MGRKPEIEAGLHGGAADGNGHAGAPAPAASGRHFIRHFNRQDGGAARLHENTCARYCFFVQFKQQNLYL